MIRVARWLLAVPLIIVLCGPKAHAQIINAASCSSAAVQTALNSVAADGTTVVIPSGTCTWTSQVKYAAIFSTTIQGQTTCTGTPATSCTDNTVINDSWGTDNGMFNISIPAAKSFRLTGLTIQNSSIQEFNGAVIITGGCPPSCTPNVRVDHMHFSNLNEVSFVENGAVGVMDHSVISENGINWNGVVFNAKGPSGLGNEAWAAASQLGSSNFFYIEDSTVTGGVANDCKFGGRYVFRHNNMFVGAGVQTHATGSGGPDERACRAFEVYQNTFQGNPSCGGGACFTMSYMNSGTGVIWGNAADANFQHVALLHSIRRSATEYPENATPGGWGYCGTSFNGTGSNWDQNSNASTGYACLDQLGRGVGDLLTGFAPSKVNSALGGITWPRQALEPLYMWLNTWTGTPAANYTVALDGISANQDYYDWCNAASTNGCTSFNGTAGVGSGLLSARPTTCTPNSVTYPAGNSPGVGYWATDTNTLYQCSAPNTWRAYYTPYTYPHPLTLGSSSGPNPATNLQVVVQ
jgi:hypothetical protein